MLLKKRIRHNSEPLLSSGHENVLNLGGRGCCWHQSSALLVEKFDVSSSRRFVRGGDDNGVLQ